MTFEEYWKRYDHENTIGEKQAAKQAWEHLELQSEIEIYNLKKRIKDLEDINMTLAGTNYELSSVVRNQL